MDGYRQTGADAEGRIPGQPALLEFLTEADGIPDGKVKINGAVNTETMEDYGIRSTYRDIFLIINMLDDYVSYLSRPGAERNYYTDYMAGQFARISEELAQQTGLDRERMRRKCGKRKEKDDTGEDAFTLAFGGKKEETGCTDRSQE